MTGIDFHNLHKMYSDANCFECHTFHRKPEEHAEHPEPEPEPDLVAEWRSMPLQAVPAAEVPLEEPLVSFLAELGAELALAELPVLAGALLVALSVETRIGLAQEPLCSHQHCPAACTCPCLLSKTMCTQHR